MTVSALGSAMPPGSSRAERAAVAARLAATPPLLPTASGPAQLTAGTVLRASRNRPVVRWTGTQGPRRYGVVGKVYGRGGGLEAYTLLSRLWQAGFDGVHGVPQPLGYEPERSLLLQSEAPPSTLHDGLADPARSVADVRRVGGWLAALHAAGDLGLPRLDPTFEPTKVASYVGALTAARPDLAARLNDVADALLVELATTDAPLVATHGDFQPKNVHLDAERVVVIDFDRASLAPAARDLGHFVGQALTMAAARSGQFATVARDWAIALLDGYVEAGGLAAAVEQTPPYVARTFLEVLFYRLIVRPGPDTSFASAWLAECACWLGSRHSCLA